MSDYGGYDSEEIANAVLHGVGLGMAIAALVVLIIVAYTQGEARHITASSIYGATLVILYLSSTLYHSFPHGRTKYVLKIIDHSAIYLMIAGTYTPITIIFLRSRLGWSVFSIVWAIALVGIITNIFWFERMKKISLLLYLIMGWLSILTLRQLLVSLSSTSIIFLVLGGVFYSVGTIFYIKKDLRFNHAIWHIFVLAGSMAHFFTVLLSLVR